MILTHGIADDTGAFPVGSVIADAKLIHIIQCTPLYRLQSIPHIRKSPGNDNTHGIINIRFLHNIRIFCSDDLFFFHFSVPPP